METAAGGSDYQPILDAVAAVLQLEVTLVSAQLVRIAGTGQYRLRIGEEVHPDSAFGQALASGRPVRVENPRQDATCLRCGAMARCAEAAHLASPILDRGRPVGVLGLVAFTGSQRQRLLHGLEGYLDFLHRMSDLIAGKLKEEAVLRALAAAQGYLRAVADSVSEALIATDATGAVTFCNEPALRMLALPEPRRPRQIADLPGLAAPLGEVLAGGHSLGNREFSIGTGRGTVVVVGNIRPIRAGQEVVGAVASLRDAGDAYDLAYRLHGAQPACGFERILYRSQAMARVVETARRVAAGRSTVLVRGESGTGKELFARALHAGSPRRDGPLIAINCAAIPDDLLESELFGYAEGAFTGARRGGKPGKFELASGGTLFLDEIGDMSLRLQAKLLRVLQESEVTRVGGTRGTRLDVRIVAATNQDLEAMMARREFREDLYFRLSVIPLEVPPLRERREDIPLLADHFRARRAREMDKRVLAFSDQAAQILLHHDWPGNVRELENAVEYAVAMAPGPVAGPDCLPARIAAAGAPAVGRNGSLADLERRELERCVARYGTGQKAVHQIASDLGVSRATVYRWLRKHRAGNPGA